MLNHLKSTGAKYLMNNDPTISRIAKILELKLEDGKANLTAKLKGECEPINISLNYAFEENAIRLTHVKTNKEWLSELADIFKDKYSTINLKDAGLEENGIKTKIIKFLAKFLL